MLGSWELSRVKCYLPTTATSYVEDYDFDSDNTLTVTIDFVNSNIQYMVSTNSCSTSATGVYSADFNGTGKGLVTLSKIVLGATTTCDVDVPFVGNGAGNGTGSVTLNSGTQPGSIPIHVELFNLGINVYIFYTEIHNMTSLFQQLRRHTAIQSFHLSKNK